MLMLSMTFCCMITLSAVLIGPVKSGSRVRNSVIIMPIRCITSGVAGNNQYVISFFHKELTLACRFIRSRIHQARAQSKKNDPFTFQLHRILGNYDVQSGLH